MSKNHNVIEYIDELHNRDDLSKGAKLMMYELIVVWNRWYKKGKDWDGWFHATDHGGADNKYVIGGRWGSATYNRYRKELIEKGYIDYERGFRTKKGNRCSRYKLLFLGDAVGQ